MKDSQDWLDKCFDGLEVIDTNNHLSTVEHDKDILIKKLRKHILQEALEMIGDDLPLDTEPNTGQRIHNKVKQELRNKFNDKYKED